MGRARARRWAALAGLTTMIAAATVATWTPVQPAGAAGAQLAPWSAGRPGSFLIAYEDPEYAVSQAANYRLFILNADAERHVPRIKAANPNAVVLAYKDLLFAAPWDAPGVTHGVTWAQA